MPYPNPIIFRVTISNVQNHFHPEIDLASQQWLQPLQNNASKSTAVVH
jgi:hypothetical protein